MASLIWEVMEYLEIQNFEYPENEAQLLHEIKKILKVYLETAFSEIMFCQRQPLIGIA